MPPAEALLELLHDAEERVFGFDCIAPPGSSLALTRETMEAASRAIEGIQGIEDVMSTVGAAKAAGAGQTQAGEVRRATMTLVFSLRDARASQSVIENQVCNNRPKRKDWLRL